MYPIGIVILVATALVTAVPQPVQSLNDTNGKFAISDAVSAGVAATTSNAPSASSSTALPTSISFPKKADNPYPNGIPQMPAGCDGNNPNQDCLKALDGSGGYLHFDPKGECNDIQQGKLETAVWDATTLAYYSSNFPNVGEANRALVAGRYWMGPGFSAFSSRIAGNFKRVWQFKTPATSSREYITISCKDTENQCKPAEGKTGGGYAKTVSSWFGYYHYITLCPPFFTTDSLDQKIDEIEADLRSGSGRKAGDMRNLQTSGQFFLHEMMHLRVANGSDEPAIVDEYLGVPRGETPGTNDLRAYGPTLVHKLAQMRSVDDGGADRATTNADSYAMLANAIWWWDTTSVFPAVPAKGAASAAPDNLFMLQADLGSTANTTLDMSGAGGQLDADLASLPSAADEAAAAPSFDPTSLIPGFGLPGLLAGGTLPADTCSDSYKFFFDSFEIYGKNFDAVKFGADGAGLKAQIGGCGALTAWSFEYVQGNPDGYQWHATGQLPIGTKSCVGSAVVAAGGSSSDGCVGAG